MEDSITKKIQMDRPSSQAGRRGPRRSVAGYDHIEQTQALMASIIHELVHAGDITALKEEFQRDKGLIEALNSEGMTPLFVAVSTGNLECVQFLATSGASLNTRDNLGRTPLALAAYQGWNDGVYYLLAVGADSTIVDNCGRLPLHAATYYSSGRTVGLLLQHLPSDHINKQDGEGMTALHWAAYHGRAEHVKLLIDHDAEIVARDTEGKTALHWAAQNGSVSCCQVILNTSSGQHLLNGKDFSGKTPLHYAAAAGHLSALQELLNERFVSVDSKDNENRVSLHWAAATGHARCVAALLRAGSDKDSVDKHGATPIMYAHQGHHDACCRLLYKHNPERPLDTEIPEHIAETIRVPTPPEIHIVSEAIIKPPELVFEPAITSNGAAVSSPVTRRKSSSSHVSAETRAEERAHDDEVQEILKASLRAVELVIDKDSYSNDNDRGKDSARSLCAVLHGASSAHMTSQASPSFKKLDSLYATMNGNHSDDGESAGYSSEDELRYPPQMVLTPIPVSPLPTEENNNNVEEQESKAQMLPRFSLEGNVQTPFLKQPSTASTLAPLKTRTVPDHLRLDLHFQPTPVRNHEVKPGSPVKNESGLGPLKVTKITKHHSPPAKQPSPVSTKQHVLNSPTRSSLGSGLPSSRESSGNERERGFSRESSDITRFWSRKSKKSDALMKSRGSSNFKAMNRSLSIPEESQSKSSLRGAAGYSEYRQFDSDSEWSRKQREKHSQQGTPGGQILPVISKDKSNRVFQVQGSLKDQIEAKRKTTKKPSRFRGGRGLFSFVSSSVEEVDDDLPSTKSSEKKEKKKVRKVMSWNA
ncbi:neurogenic locus notch homolog protein 1 isoform X2 [Nematostella vectensis]|uniref:neurogenic locus notch homolog protein 1 isoform X2 n=1 Tax=Nematostella vectensis TaxID=45351 RepID=UPI0020773ABE|nr:neurogenic locus notch homolog protein 1 isoform X2 [Nematostella vectensis]